MIFYSITVSIIMKKMKITHILINTDYLVYRAISSIFIRKTGLKHISIFTRKLIGIGGKEGRINKIVKIEIDIDRYK